MEDEGSSATRAGWWTVPCLALLALAPVWIFLHAFGCGVGENADYRARRVCERLGEDDWLSWFLPGAAALPILLVTALLAPRRVTLVTAAALFAAQVLLVVFLER